MLASRSQPAYLALISSLPILVLLTAGITAKRGDRAMAEEVYAAAFVALESAGTLALERF